MSESSTPVDVRSVLLPLEGGVLLLPNAAVSEVIGYQNPEPMDGHVDAPDWLKGILPWRERNVPLVTFESAIGQSLGEIGHRARIAICNTLNGNADVPFVAIQLKSAPHLVRATEETISPLESPSIESEMILSSVLVNGEEAWIPNLDSLEKAVQPFIK